eukprot:602029-Prorocentrum_minimum.AAC.3
MADLQDGGPGVLSALSPIEVGQKMASRSPRQSGMSASKRTPLAMLSPNVSKSKDNMFHDLKGRRQNTEAASNRELPTGVR